MVTLKKSLALLTVLPLALALSGCKGEVANEPEITNDETPKQVEPVTEKEISSELDLVIEYFNNDDLAACDTLKLSNLQKQCRHNIVFSRATKKGDAEICDTLTDKVEAEECKLEVESRKQD